MSLQSFQSALAYVLRSFDVEQRKSLDELSGMYDLSSDEKNTLGHLINQYQLKSYSEELFLARWTIIREGLAFLDPFIDMKAMSLLWEKNFDPKSNAIVQEDLILKFLEFLVFDPIGANFISKDAPAFLPSLVRYVHAVFTFKHNYLPEYGLPPDSALTKRYFMVIDLHFDVREFFAELLELKNFSNLALTPPPHGDLSLLFVASDKATEFRSFEIDKELANFLAAELQGKQGPRALPPCYGDLVELGLCQPLGLRTI